MSRARRSHAIEMELAVGRQNRLTGMEGTMFRDYLGDPRKDELRDDTYAQLQKANLAHPPADLYDAILRSCAEPIDPASGPALRLPPPTEGLLIWDDLQPRRRSWWRAAWERRFVRRIREEWTRGGT